MTDHELRERVARAMAYANRASLDASTDANDHWQHTSADTQDVWLNLANTAISVIVKAQLARAEAAEAKLADATLEAERTARLEAEAERDDARRARDWFQRTTRAHWEALCAMRNSINEHVPMPSIDSGPLLSPEDDPIYADIATRVVSAIASMKGEADG